MKLTNADTAAPLLHRLEIADTFLLRLRGLQFRKTLANDAGLLLSPCSSLHTCFMRFPIDVVMLDADGCVLAIRRNVPPWRIVFCPRSTCRVIETNVGALQDVVGSRLSWR